MALLARKRVVTAKIETTYGTDATPLGAQAILVRNLNMTPQDQDLANRDLVRPYLGNSQQLPAAIRATIDFEVEIAGAGAAGTAPGYGALLRACGLAETVSAGVSVTYAPISAAFESASIYFNVDGVLHKMLGSRGTVSFALSVKNIPVYKFKFTGLYSAVTDTAAVTPVYTAFQLPLVVNNVNTTPFTLHGYSAVMSELSIDMAAEIVHRTLVGGSEAVLFTDRKPAGSITVEAGTIAAKDWFALAKAATTGALDITHGITAGNKVQITAPNVQLTKPNYSEMDGIQMLQMGMNLIPGSSGNDEFSVVVK
jgi:hypothetical protein